MTIKIGASTTSGLQIQPDNSGALEFRTNNGTTALTIDTSQNATFAGTLTATGKLVSSSMPTGSVLQVVSTTKTDTFSSAATNTWTDITGLSVSITPTSSSNTILVMASVQGINTASNAYFRLVRGSTAIGVGTTAGSRSSVSSSNIFGSGSNSMGGSSFQFLDAPATTSSTTYKIQFITDVATTYINRTSGDTDALYVGRSQSTITVMEIKG